VCCFSGAKSKNIIKIITNLSLIATRCYTQGFINTKNKMDYQKYIDLGFERTDMNDQVEFNQTGFGGFSLEKKFKRGMSICISSGELTQPHLYIKKRSGETYHIVTISEECVIDICNNNGQS
jgi:hypothetical protein